MIPIRQPWADPIEDISPLAHCHECGLWLRPEQSCLHIAPAIKSPPSGEPSMSDQYLALKWGTLKAWNLRGNEAAMAAIRRYNEAGSVSFGAMTQRDNAEQKLAICEMIDAVDGPITNDWSGEEMTKDEAKKYVLEYRQ